MKGNKFLFDPISLADVECNINIVFPLELKEKMQNAMERFTNYQLMEIFHRIFTNDFIIKEENNLFTIKEEEYVDAKDEDCAFHYDRIPEKDFYSREEVIEAMLNYHPGDDYLVIGYNYIFATDVFNEKKDLSIQQRLLEELFNRTQPEFALCFEEGKFVVINWYGENLMSLEEFE